MTASVDEFRDILRLFASGVTIVTSRAEDTTHGMTATAFTSISADPPLVAVAVNQVNTIVPLLAGDDACFAVNVLAEDQRDLADRFAFEKDEDRFLVGRWGRATTGAPVLEDALAWLDCQVVGRHPGGSHTIYIGTVKAGRVVRPETRPLVYWDRAYRLLERRGT